MIKLATKDNKLNCNLLLKEIHRIIPDITAWPLATAAKKKDIQSTMNKIHVTTHYRTV